MTDHLPSDRHPAALSTDEVNALDDFIATMETHLSGGAVLSPVKGAGPKAAEGAEGAEPDPAWLTEQGGSILNPAGP